MTPFTRLCRRAARNVNALSIDAVAVGVLWQAIFTRSFRADWPTFFESITLAMTLWLIYTADHLLDATRLNLDRRHTFRHRFHHQHQRVLAALWILVTVVDTGLIIATLDDSLIRWGLALAGAVLSYGASVHFRSGQKPVIGKEVQVGSIFAIGVGLLAWDHQPSVDLAIATSLAAVLFSSNCVLVGLAESEADRQQDFPSLANQIPAAAKATPKILVTLFFVALAVTLTGTVPKFVSCSIAISSLMLACTATPRQQFSVKQTASRYRSSPSIVLADAMLMVPIGLWWWA
ncbi:hypothetical protein [Rubripirellula reticaptiva]|uniref:Prenyltransferase n=1 Tax=Rubripirellula reticaptiva TaxID=2528013 RepID=A0A5C6ES78_9BACT|nr:hypothetical protein [Rubripirellula reticaptiva]TWU51214.1 hypothetical protein Poly59_28050 [Rubripirellula reticaptiva]